VIGTINDANYQGSATDTLVINAATLTYTANAGERDVRVGGAGVERFGERVYGNGQSRQCDERAR